MQDKLENEFSLAEILDALYFKRVLVLGIVLLFGVLGAIYAMHSPAIYKSNLLIQVEGEKNSLPAGGTGTGSMGSLFGGKTQSAAEAELLRSRLLVSNVVDQLGLDYAASPRYLPVIGRFLAQRSKGDATSREPAWRGYASGGEKITVSRFSVPREMEGIPFALVSLGDGKYRLEGSGFSVEGQTGRLEKWKINGSDVELQVAEVVSRPGTTFDLLHFSHQNAVDGLQGSLKIGEKAKGTDLLQVELEGGNPVQLAAILNKLGELYVQQNKERRVIEAKQSLDFLNGYLPTLKDNVEKAEELLVAFNEKNGSVDLSEEAKVTMQNLVATQGKLEELKLKRQQLLHRFTSEHPAVRDVDSQLQEVMKRLNEISGEIRQYPSLQRKAMWLERDVKVNWELYTNLMSMTQQMKLAEAGITASVWVVDKALVPDAPIKPNRKQIFLLFLGAGILIGVLLAVGIHSMTSGIQDSKEIEDATQLPVYASIPSSPKQEMLFKKVDAKEKGVWLLAKVDAHDMAMESLRSFRTALQFAMLDAKNNIVMITGPLPQVGKSFVSTNFAAVLAESGKKVLLVDMDLRKGYINHYFGMPRHKGMAEVILGEIDIDQAIRHEVYPNLDVLTTGEIPSNPNALLISKKVGELLEMLKEKYDIVILDTPPILAVTDAVVLSSHAGSVILVVREGTSTVGEIDECKKRLLQVGTNITGVLLNAVRPRPQKYYGKYSYGKYKYRYRYSSYAYDAYRKKD